MSHRIGNRFSKMLKRWTLLGKVCTSSTVKMISLEDWQEKREGSSGEVDHALVLEMLRETAEEWDDGVWTALGLVLLAADLLLSLCLEERGFMVNESVANKRRFA